MSDAMQTPTQAGVALAWDEDTVADATATMAEPLVQAWTPQDFEVTVEYATMAAAQDDTASTVLGKGVLRRAASNLPTLSAPTVKPPKVAEGSSPAIDVSVRGDEEATQPLPEVVKRSLDPISPASVSLIADAEAILAAFREPPAPSLAQQMVMACVALPAPPAPRKSWLARSTAAIVDFADRLGGRVVDRAESFYHWVEASRFGQAMRRRPCRCCQSPRQTTAMFFGLPNMSVDQLTSIVGQRSWDIFRALPPCTSPHLGLQLTMQSCPKCGRHRTVELTWVQGSWRKIVAKNMDLDDSESFFLLSLAR